MILAPASIPVLAAIALAASWSDLRERRLSNVLVAITAASGLALAIVTGGAAGLGSAILHCLVAIAVGLPLFAWGVLGGGDVKFYAAVAAWFPLEQGFRLLAGVSLTGAVLAAAWLIGQRTGYLARTDNEDAHRDMLPFGIAIGSGALLTALAFPR